MEWINGGAVNLSFPEYVRRYMREGYFVGSLWNSFYYKPIMKIFLDRSIITMCGRNVAKFPPHESGDGGRYKV